MDQKNAIRKPTATRTLKPTRTRMTLMRIEYQAKIGI
jgi:hypothetical protein